ncbi:hypothetical protein [Nesterenkonia ebinurensis]|uniref:hypothetical protein n=1 Tax=Nesterenkonia ebinurensis TaxID=2608252 RepID=UPI00168A6790|nr:hypothetical protein [Nesterenkonia ebinurensis]
MHELEIPIAGDTDNAGWADLVAVQPTDSNNHSNFISARHKRARTVRECLMTLERAGLVSISGAPKERNRFGGFVLLNEAGPEVGGGQVEYTVPRRREKIFKMPSGFVLKGWIHLLEDSEIAVLLMAACHSGGWPEDGLWAIPGDVRLRHYGIHRDRYSVARKTLEWLGLLNVDEVNRFRSGRAEKNARLVHRIGLRDQGFEVEALPKMRELLERQLSSDS